MTKQTDDLIDRIQGAATALKGVKAKLSPQPAVATPPDVPAQPPAEVTQEDYDHAKKVVAELKSNVEALEAEVSRESKVPGEHQDNKSKEKASSGKI